MKHDDYIKRSDVLELAREYYTPALREEAVPVRAIRNIPSADVAPIKHGEWEVLESFSDPLDGSHKDRCRCTNCGFIHVFTDFHYGQYNFCPNCGSEAILKNIEEER